MIRTTLITLFVLASFSALAESYAPMADISDRELRNRNWMATQLERATAPEADAVDLPAYPGAVIVYIGQSAQIRADRYQEIETITLYTVDPQESVVAFFRTSKPDWVWRKPSCEHPYPIRGGLEENLVDNPETLMSGPRISLTQLDREANPPDSEIEQMLEMAQGSRTSISIEYPGRSYELISADEDEINQALQRCIPHKELQDEKNAQSSIPPAQRELTHADYKSSLCSAAHQTCERETKGVACQDFLRLYAD
jgi:hypothetical protein